MQKFERNSDGLLSHVEYKLSDDGFVNWRAMIKPEFLVPDKNLFTRRNVEVPKTIEGLKDNELLILLAGIKNLASLRGFSRVDYKVESPSNDYVIATCSITFVPNFETEGREVTFSAIGDASLKSTTGFGQLFLGAIAENRAFVRCVRNFLKINILGQDEVAPNNVEVQEEKSSPLFLLNQIMNEKNVSFSDIRQKMINEGLKSAENWNSLDDIPKVTIFQLISRIKNKS
jgi:hypothetical protein